jgi:hypothetical protein
LIIHCSTGDDGQCGDGYILCRTGLVNVLWGNVIFLSFIVLGDSAYLNNDVIVSVYKGHPLPQASAAFNGVMCLIQTCVDWGCKKIVQYWAFLDFTKQMKIQQSAIISMYHLAVFFMNCLYCANGGNKISSILIWHPLPLKSVCKMLCSCSDHFLLDPVEG